MSLPTIQNLKDFCVRHRHEFLRTVPLFLVSFLAFYGDQSFSAISYVIGILTVIALSTHVLRKALFPYIDLQAAAKKASESPTGAAALFASVSGLLMMLIWAFVELLK